MDRNNLRSIGSEGLYLFLIYQEAVLFGGSVGSDPNDLERDLLPTALYSPLHSIAQTATAGDSHTGEGDRTDTVIPEDLLKLLLIIHRIQLGTADEQNLSVPKALMEIGPTVGTAICGNKKSGIL